MSEQNESNVHDDELNTVDDGKMDFEKKQTHTRTGREMAKRENKKKNIKTNSMKPNVCSFCIYRPSCAVHSVCTHSVHVTYFVRRFNDS